MSSPCPTPKFNVSFTCSPLGGSPCYPAQPISLNVTAIAEKDGCPPVTFTWSFGDGTTGTGPSVTHAYAAPGTYLVNAMAATPSGAANAIAAVKVAPSPNAVLPAPLFSPGTLALLAVAFAVAGAVRLFTR